jgi:CheY-like chemotaxis protein
MEENIKILVADSDFLVRDRIRGALKKDYPQIEESLDARQAMNFVKENKYDLIIMGTQMPNDPKDYEICRQIRQLSNEIAIIATSIDDSYRKRWLEAGADDVIIYNKILTDPFKEEQDNLKARIQEALEKHQPQYQNN